MKLYYYDKIAKDYNLKRKKPWKPLQEFINYLSEQQNDFTGICLDLGCGNGRNFELFKKESNKLIGIDNSIELLKIAKENQENFTLFSKLDSNNISLILGDLQHLPIRESMVNTIFSIAAIHHIKTIQNRREAINQIFKIMPSNGQIILTVWRRWQKKLKKYFLLDWLKRKFNRNYKNRQRKKGLPEFGDKYVPWTVPKEQQKYNRFYHFFSKREIKKLLKNYHIQIFRVMGGPNTKDNFFILASH